MAQSSVLLPTLTLTNTHTDIQASSSEEVVTVLQTGIKAKVSISYNRTDGYSNYSLNENYNNISNYASETISTLKDIAEVFEYFCTYEATWMNHEYTSWILIVKLQDKTVRVYTNETNESFQDSYQLVEDPEQIRNYLNYYSK
jgi:hypothetical protein